MADFVRVNFILPKDIYHALKALIPQRKRSKVVTSLIKGEIKRREKELYNVARAVEEDKGLNQEMKEWDVTLNDGMEDMEWK